LRAERTFPESFLSALRIVAPGTVLREGIDNILRAKTGGLLVIGDERVKDIVEGGFEINSPLTAAKIYELAKMDGAIILDERAENIWKANAQLVPQGGLASEETGIRHRIAERVARQTGVTVISISQRRSLITVYKGAVKYIMPEIGVVLTKANQAIQTLEKYRSVLEKTLVNLTISEFEDTVSLLDVAKAIQRVEMTKWIAGEIDLYLAQLGTEGLLVNMQLEELRTNICENENLLLLDYTNGDEKNLAQLIKSLGSLDGQEFLELPAITKILGYGNSLGTLDLVVNPRGYRVLSKLPRLPFSVVENVVHYFGRLQNILNASLEELDQVEGIGEVRAKAIKTGLTKLKEQILLDRYF